MKRIILYIIAAVSLFSICFCVSYAHPGRTDSNGGHYNRETGEYHYHNDGTPQNRSVKQTEKEKTYFIENVVIPIIVLGICILPFLVGIKDKIVEKIKERRKQ